MNIRRVWPETVYRRTAPGSEEPVYAQVVEVSRPDGSASIYLAGTFPGDVGLNLIGEGDITVQVAAALENIRLSLETAGAAVSDIVRIKLYVTDIEMFKTKGSSAYIEFFAGSPAASTAVEVAGFAMPGALVEIEAYAERA